MGFEGGYYSGYDEGFEAGYDKAMAFIEDNNRRADERFRRFSYFLMQRIIGVFILIMTVFVVHVADDMTFALVSIPFSVWIIFTKERLIKHGRENERRSNC